MPTSFGNTLRWEDSFRVVLVQHFHRQEARNLSCRLHFGETPFGATKQNQNASKLGRSSISVRCVLRRINVIPNDEGKALAPAPVAMRCSRPQFQTERP